MGLKLGLVDGIDNIEAYISKKWCESGQSVNVYRIEHKKKFLENVLDNLGVSTSASVNAVFSKLSKAEFNAMNIDVANSPYSSIYC